MLEVENMKQEVYCTYPMVHFQRKFVEILLRMCDTETCQSTVCKIIGKAKVDRLSCKCCKVVQVTEEEIGDMQEGEKPTMRFQVQKLITVLHH